MKPGIQWLMRLFGPARAPAVAAAYRDALDPATPRGRAVMADLAHYCRVGQTSFVAGDPHQTAFNEGARDVFLHVAELVGVSPDDFPPLLDRGGIG